MKVGPPGVPMGLSRSGTNCGDGPTEPTEGGATSVVILVPDKGGDGLAARMKKRAATLRRLYPELMVIESWKITGFDSWLQFFSR